MVSSNSVPESTLGTPTAWTPQPERGQRPKAATGPPAARPCTKRGRDGADSPSARPKESEDMETPGKGRGLAGRALPCRCGTADRVHQRLKRRAATLSRSEVGTDWSGQRTRAATGRARRFADTGRRRCRVLNRRVPQNNGASTRSDAHPSELQSLM